MLHHSISPGTAASHGSSGRERAAAEWTLADADGINALLIVIAACLTAAHASLQHTIAGDSGDVPSSAKEAHQALARIAGHGPCQALSGVVRSENLNGNDTPGATVSLSLSAAVSLLRLCSISPPLSVVLLPDLRTTHFVAYVCNNIHIGLNNTSWAGRAIASLEALLDTFAHVATVPPEAQSELALLVLSTPQARSVVLAALKVWGGTPSLPGSAHRLRFAVYLTRWSLTRQRVVDRAVGDPAGTSAGTSAGGVPAFELTAEHLRDVVHAASHHPVVFDLALTTLPLMWDYLPAGQRSRAVMPTTLFARRILDAALRHLDLSAVVASYLDTEHSVHSGGRAGLGRHAAACRRAGTMSTHTSSGDAAAVAFLHEALMAPGQEALSQATRALRLLSGCLVPEAAVAAEGRTAATIWEGLQPRALMIFRGKLCGSLEALLRASGPCPSSQVADLVGATSGLSADFVALLCEDLQAPTVAADTLSMLSTLRKLLQRLLHPAQGLAVPGHAVAGGVGRTEEGDAHDDVAHAATQVLSSFFQHSLLMTLRETGEATAVSLHSSMLLQILPLAVRAHTAVQPLAGLGSSQWGERGCHLLAVVTAANEQRLGSLTAAAGGPRLLHTMLSAVGVPGNFAEAGGSGNLTDSLLNGLEVAGLCLAALLAAGSDSAWLAEGQRLQLAPRAAAWLGVQVTREEGQQAPQRPQSGMFRRNVLMAQRLRTNLSAYAPRLVEGLSPGTDAALLSRAIVRHTVCMCSDQVEGDASPATPPQTQSMLHAYIFEKAEQQQTAAQPSGGPQSAYLVGCWHLRCTNLDGDSEAALKTYTCGGCMLARFCSKECQRSAWRGGHRAVCNALQEAHATTRQHAASTGQSRPGHQARSTTALEEPACSTSRTGAPDIAEEGAAAAAEAAERTAATAAAAAVAECKAVLVAAVQVAEAQAAEAAVSAAAAAAIAAVGLALAEKAVAASVKASKAAEAAVVRSAVAAGNADNLRAQLAAMN